MNRYMILGLVFCALAFTGCAGFEALLGPSADPAVTAAVVTTATTMIPPPFNLLIPGAFGVLTALFAPKEPQL